MSFMATVKTEIQDLQLFREICEQNQVDFQETSTGALLTDQVGRASRTTAELVQAETGYSLVWDNDPSYCSLSRRFGQNGGKLLQGYSEAFITRGLTQQGGMITSREERANGEILLRVAVGGGV